MSLLLRKHIENIVPLADTEFEYILSYFTFKKFRKHQFLIQEGDDVKNDYFILQGLVKASRTDEDGKEHIVQFATEESWITDPQAYHNQTKATLDVSCLEPCETFFITLSNREKLCQEMQKMEFYFRKITTAGYIMLQRRILCLISNNANERYTDFLRQYPDLIQRIPKTMIASYLGVSRETLSRLLSTSA